MEKLPFDFPAGISVTQRRDDTKQPRGGYLNPKALNAVVLGEGIDCLAPLKEENVRPTLVGTAVDYLTRVSTGASVDEVFIIACAGADIVHELDNARELKGQVVGLDAQSITAALRLAVYDSVYRGGPKCYQPVQDIKPNDATISNIETMVNRGVAFFDAVGPKVMDGLTFEGGYTEFVKFGDGDFMTEDTLWEFKVSIKPPTKEHTLQLMMYWQLGLHSIHPEFQNITKLGVFNPRLNTMYTINVANIDEDVVNEVAGTIVGYDLDPHAYDPF